MIVMAILQRVERLVVTVLLTLMMAVVLLATVELCVVLVRQVLAPPFLMLNLKTLLELFGFFLMVLIGLELLETIKAYLRDECFRVEVVLLVAIIAVSRKIIIMEPSELVVANVLAIAALVVALTSGYYLVKRVQPAGPARHGA